MEAEVKTAVGTPDSGSWITRIFQEPVVIGQYAAWAMAVFVLMVAISLAISLVVLIRLPADYFRTHRAEGIPGADRDRFSRARTVARNVLGAILVVIGAILSVPGVPGQGLLTMLVGVLLLDFRGKHELLYRILSRPRLLKAVNRLRKRFSRPPFVIT
jgi:hypothetical protein